MTSLYLKTTRCNEEMKLAKLTEAVSLVESSDL